MKKFITLLMLCSLAFTACDNKDNKDTPDNPDPEVPAPKPLPPTPPVPPAQQTEPPRSRGFMVSRAEHLTAKDLSDARSWGANLIRLQLTPASYAVEKVHTSDVFAALPAYFDNVIIKRIQEAERVGMRVLLDLHQAPITVNGNAPTVDYEKTTEFWNSPNTKASFIKFWQMIAERLKDAKYNNVIWGYDLYNEAAIGTNWAPSQQWMNMADDIVAAIRKIDSDVWVVYQPGTSISRWADVKPLKDKRVVYSYHYYAPSGFTHQGVQGRDKSETFYLNPTTRAEALKKIRANIYPGKLKESWEQPSQARYWDKNTMIQFLEPFDKFVREHKVPALIGEFSVICWSDVPSSTKWLKDAMEVFESKGYSWCYHAFREWQAWSLEQPEGPENFWAKGGNMPAPSKTETQRAKVVKAGLKKNKF
jgi:glycoside hydrolase, family 5